MKKVKSTKQRVFKTVFNEGMSNAHDFDKNPTVEGEVKGIKTVMILKGTKREKETRILNLINDAGIIAVWESATLKFFFDKVIPGDLIRITYLGQSENHKKGQQPAKLYKCEIAE
jgi:hypothetical protein